MSVLLSVENLTVCDFFFQFQFLICLFCEPRAEQGKKQSKVTAAEEQHVCQLYSVNIYA